MLGLLLVFFVGKYFYDLAGKFNKSKWLFAIVGITSYYAGTFLVGLAIAFMREYGVSGDIGSMSGIGLNLLALPAGVLSSWLTYSLLKKSWSKSRVDDGPDDVLDSNLLK